MTNHWIDIRNSDCILVMGSNAAENHPVSFKWVTKAQEAGAKLIHVDPRFTRTSARADIYAPLRPGTDIAFLGGMLNHILQNGLEHREYLANYTNASFIVGPGYSFHDGLFSGFDPQKCRYDKGQWDFVRDENGMPRRDKTLENPGCVYQVMKQHYSRYSPEVVSRITGTSEKDLLKVWRAYGSSGARDKTGTIMYAMGWTQHTVGVQTIRLMSMIQLVLGNIGRPGGGVNALRGESNVQGSTDHAILYHILPGYLQTPKADLANLEEYCKRFTPKANDPQSANWWQNKPKYMVSYLKAVYGDAADEQNQWGYDWLPKTEPGRGHTWVELFEDMHRGKIKGFFAWGQNPACSGADAGRVRESLAKLDWLVTVNLFDNETSSFWHGPGVDPATIDTEVFLLPAAVSVEKEGSITNSGRWMQWRYKAAEPPGQCRPDGDIVVDLHRRLKALYGKGGVFGEPVLNLRLDGDKDGRFDAAAAAKQINGRFERDAVVKGKKFKKGDQAPSFAYLTGDGATSSGNWLYCGSYTNDGNMAARRDPADPTGMGMHHGWAWCWPVNRRILYNRASVDLNGKAWSPGKNILEWKQGKWVGDVPDGGWPPMLVDPAKTRLPFIMKPDGVGSVFGPGLKDGPMPEHYEPMECPVAVNLLSSQLTNPAVVTGQFCQARLATCDPRFPIVATTYRVTEHWQTGVMTRWQPWLLEMQPQLFVEMSHELAREQGIKNGGICRISSIRGSLEAVAIVTPRLRPMMIEGQTVHFVGLPWCYGWVQPKGGGDSANLLTPSAGDPNTKIPETKAFMVNVERVERG